MTSKRSQSFEPPELSDKKNSGSLTDKGKPKQVSFSKVTRFLFRTLLWGSLTLLMTLAVLLVGIQTDSGKEIIITQARNIAAQSGQKFELEQLETNLPFSLQFQSLKIMDENGVWLDLIGFKLNWNPWSLFSGELFINQFTLDQLTLARMPNAEQEENATRLETSKPFNLELPVGITLNRFAIGKISLGKNILGESAQFTLAGSADLGDLEKGIFAKVALKRIDRTPAFLNADIVFNPFNHSLRLSMDAGEPAGGLFGKLLDLRGNEPVSATIKGSGLIKEWKCLIDVKAGTGLWLKGDATIQTDSQNISTLKTNLKGSLKSILPKRLHPLQGKEIIFSSAVSKETSGALQLRSFNLSGKFGEITTKGKIDLPGSKMNLDYFLKVSTVGDSLVQGVHWKSLALSGNAKGPIKSPVITSTLKITHPQSRLITLDSFDLSLTARPATHLNASSSAWDVQANMKAVNPQRLDPKVLDLLGPQPNFDIQLTANLENREVLIHRALLTVPNMNLQTRGRLVNWGETLLLNNQVEIPDLSQFNHLTTSKLGGSLSLTAESKVSNSGKQINSLFAAKTNRFSSGITELDNILKEDVFINGKLSRNPEGQIDVSKLVISARPVTITANASLDSRNHLFANWNANLPQINFIEKTIGQHVSGKLKITGQATGNIQHIQVKAQLESPQIKFNDISMKHLKASLTGQNLAKQPNGSIQLLGHVQGLETQLKAHYRLTPQKVVHVSGLGITLPGLELRGNLSHSILSGLSKGSIEGGFSELSMIANTFDQQISGKLQVKVTAFEEYKQSLRFSLNGSDLSVGKNTPITLSKANLTGRIHHLLDSPEINSKLILKGMKTGKGILDTLNGKVKGKMNDLTWAFQSTGHFKETVRANLNGQWSQSGAGSEFTISRLEGSFGKTPIESVNPIKLEFSDDVTKVSNLDLRVLGGQIQADLFLGSPRQTLSANFNQIPLALLDHALPELKIRGQLNGQVNLSGSPANPDGTTHLNVSNVHSLNVEDSKQYMGTGNIDINLKNDLISAQAAFKQPRIGHLSFNGSIPILKASHWDKLISNSAALNGKLNGDIDLTGLNPFLVGAGNWIRGHLNLNGSAQGTVGFPQLTGSVNLKEGEYQIVQFGTHLKNITLDLSATPGSIHLKRLSANTPEQGVILAKGTLHKTKEIDYTANFTVKMNQAILAAIDMLKTQVSSDLTLKGPLSNSVLSGNVEINKAEIRIPDKLPSNLVVVEVERKPKSGHSEKPSAKDSNTSTPPIQSRLDVKIHAPNQIYLKGRGLEAEMQGNIHVTGTTNTPNANGKLKVRQGLWKILGKNLKFKRGIISLENAPKKDPEIDFEAEVDDPKWKIIFSLTGPATQPSISYRSIPQMPQDEILSRFLFNKDAGNITPFEAIKLASSAAELAGLTGSGPSITDKLSSNLGLDSVDIGGDGDGGAKVEAGKYISDKVFVGVTQGSKPGSTGAKVQVEVTPNLKIEGEMTGTSDSKLGLNWEMDY
ncbi:MAG: hypothetical protein G3M70_10660 [Candidatus Nitronauta litoralis]|uniref:Translocation and assembly module TamB C-terminal domain-containing protein n=1 Tax=Candidatus Nitronauta litoralis TaxID=2705533 RepID=A0A7T0BWM4_9BACT|nr:MAG: hypothetical protein G3M70_10660 [Candidatus Nitronauta litoralis]